MSQSVLPDYVFEGLIRFIHEVYREDLPNSLLIAQAFCLKFPDYGKQFGVSAINKAIEDGINQGLFD